MPISRKLKSFIATGYYQYVQSKLTNSLEPWEAKLFVDKLTLEAAINYSAMFTHTTTSKIAATWLKGTTNTYIEPLTDASISLMFGACIGQAFKDGINIDPFPGNLRRETKSRAGSPKVSSRIELF